MGLWVDPMYPEPPDPYAVWKWFQQHDREIMSTEYHAMAIRQCHSGKPEDQYVNNFYFLADDDKPTAADDINAALVDFYQTAGPNRAIAEYYHPCVMDEWVVKVYKMTDAKPREPIVRLNAGISTRVSAGQWPEESAVCLSFSAASPHTARRRGRVYLGPLCSGVVTQDATSKAAYVSATFQADIAAGAVRLAGHVDAGWLTHSSMAGGSFAVVETGWVDDAFDTQRRRGPAARARFTWAKA